MTLDRSVLRQRRRELAEMVNAWDPVGLIAMGAPDDEYGCIVDDVLGALERGDSAATLAGYLAAHLPEHFGVRVADPGPFVERAVAWYRTRSGDGTGGD